MQETFKNFETKKWIEKIKVNFAVKLTVKSKDNLKNDDKKNEENIEIFSVDLRKNSQSDAFFSQFLYDLRFSWIINHDFNIHVVNNIMKKRFIKKRDCIDNFTIISNNKSLLIKTYDKIKINVKTLNEKDIMTLINVIYVSNFMINVVAESILENKKLHFDIQHRHLHRNDFVVILMFRAKAHYVLENNKKFEEMIAFVIFIRADITHDWHQLLAHANNEIIQHLITAAEEIKFINQKSVLKINKCEECAFAKVYKIVSRSFDKSETLEKSFFCITYDFIVISTAMNKNQWIFHVICFIIDFHMIYIHSSKT